MNWLAAALSDEFDCAVKTRYRQSDLPCRVRVGGATVQVSLRKPASAVTPGQYAVFYDGDVCLGGGVIARRRNSRMARAQSPIILFSAEGS
jgi:tRNA-specific 2-thiouridylase